MQNKYCDFPKAHVPSHIKHWQPFYFLFFLRKFKPSRTSIPILKKKIFNFLNY